MKTDKRGGKVLHGHSRRGERSPEYRAWLNMRQRCTSPKHKFFARYGGRGVRVCERWLVFENFLADMGPRPTPGHSLDRINNDGNYEPGNCRWATLGDQARNKRNTVMLEFQGERLCLSDMAARHGILAETLFYRLKRGMSIADALTVPVPPRKKG